MTWRAIKDAVAGLLAGLSGGILLGVLLLIWAAAIASLIGGPGGWQHAVNCTVVTVLVPVLLPWVLQGLTLLQRSRIRATLGTEIPAPARTSGASSWLAGPWLDAATWRQLGFHLLAVVTGPVGALFAVLFPVWPWLARQVTRTDERLVRVLLGPGRREELTLRVESLARSRADLVDAADAERRRIERDLHDGAQQRLVSLAMNLGMARERLDGESEPVRQALASAHDEAVLALTELRQFIRGLHPAVLSDRGLVAALSGLAARSPLPVKLQVDVPRPASAAVEAVAYFIVSEALTNVVKHAQASRVEVAVTRTGSTLLIAVADDGRGGAATGRSDGVDGTGLRGLAQRAAAVDGTLSIDSPFGGPTVITAELPCES
jgi:signal transduction histidine kinase